MKFKRYLRQYFAHKPRPRIWRAFNNYFHWRKGLSLPLSPLQVGIPRLNFNAADFILQKMSPLEQIAEYGSGGSTLFFLRQNCLVVTVEHDPGWFRAVELAVRAEGHQGRWTGLHETPFVIPGSPNHDYENPDSYFSSESRNLNYRSYASALDRFPDAFFDLVLVDGRARPSCIKHAVAKVKLGGFLVVDNTERSYYLSDKTRAHLKNFLPVFDEFGPTPGLGHFTRATIFQKLANI